MPKCYINDSIIGFCVDLRILGVYCARVLLASSGVYYARVLLATLGVYCACVLRVLTSISIVRSFSSSPFSLSITLPSN